MLFAKELFANVWGMDYPYCELRETRSRYYFKWILLHSGREKVPRKYSRHAAVLASCFDNETLDQLVYSKQGIPLTEDMSEIMDWIDGWGRDISHFWYQETMDLFSIYFSLKERVTKKELLYEVIAIRIREQIHQAYTLTLFVGWTTFNSWRDWFDSEFDENPDFFHLAYNSMRFIKQQTDAVVNETNIVVATAVNAPEMPTPAVTRSNVISP